jgi:hypothetical protein
VLCLLAFSRSGTKNLFNHTGVTRLGVLFRVSVISNSGRKRSDEGGFMKR